MQEGLLKKRYFERGIIENLKKFNLFFFFCTQLFFMDKNDKQKGLGTSY